MYGTQLRPRNDASVNANPNTATPPGEPSTPTTTPARDGAAWPATPYATEPTSSPRSPPSP